MTRAVFYAQFAIFATIAAFAQSPENDYWKIEADATDPLYTTYAAPIERSRLYGDKAYKMDYYSDATPHHFGGDEAGRFYALWKIDKVLIYDVGEYHKKPVVVYSFPDMATYRYEPFPGVEVEETFLVYSSTMAAVRAEIANATDDTLTIDYYPILELGDDSLHALSFDAERTAWTTRHRESKERLISNLYANAPYPTDCRDYFAADFDAAAFGAYDGPLDDVYRFFKTDYYDEDWKSYTLNRKTDVLCDLVALHGRFELLPGESRTTTYYRGWQAWEEDEALLRKQREELRDADWSRFLDANLKLFAEAPRIDFDTETEKLVYLGALNLARGSMLPPSGETSHNFYVFSRQPLWGWGHGHQVLHESLSMLAYAFLDSESAQGSQRVYMEQQAEDGLIAYRHGPRGLQDYPHDDMPTTSAPFYSWINWEVYQVSRDEAFLRDAYASGARYLEWLKTNRDKDGDGLYEWGPYGIIENVRDWYNVVFQVSEERKLDVDKEDISDELECLDLSLMILNETRHLRMIAEELGETDAAARYAEEAEALTARINDTMWDDETGFYYHVDMKNHEFQYLTRGLKRMEIIGFLALWANAAPPDRAKVLVAHLLDEDKFWRRYGVPTLAADDPHYSPHVDYCCKWNGPVWLLWDYLVFQGLIDYGYDEIALELADKMTLAVATQLAKNHNFWESFSADNATLNSPSNYIWDCIMARVYIDAALIEARLSD